MKQQTAWMPVTALVVLLCSMAGVKLSLAAEPTSSNKPIGLPPPADTSVKRPASEPPEGQQNPSGEAHTDRAEGIASSVGDERLHSEAFADEDPPSGVTTKRKGADTDGSTHKTSAAFAKESQPIRTKTTPRTHWLSAKPSGTAGTGQGYTKGLLSLAVVLALIGLVAYGVRRWLPGMKRLRSAGLEILGQTHLSPKQSVAIVRMGRHLVMIGVTPERISRLAVVQDPGEVAEVLVQLKTGKPLSAEDRFEPALYQAEQAFAESEWEPDGDTMPRTPANEYDRTRGQIRSLLSKVRSLTGNRRVG